MDRRVGALCGIAAPVSFVGGWALAGAASPGYNPVEQHISDLAAVGAQTRPLMTTAMVGFGLLAPVWAVTLARSLGSRAVAASVAGAGLATLAVAALPLGSSHGDGPHAAAAAAAYVAMAATPLLAARRLEGPSRLASWATGLASTAMLTGSTLGAASGAMQRAGLGVVDVWFVAMAVRELRRR